MIAMGSVLEQFGDVDMALQDAFTIVVSTEVVVTAVATKFVASLILFWVPGQLKLTVLAALGQLTADVILTVTGVNSAT